MPSRSAPKLVYLPRHWATHLRSAVLHAICLAQAALTYAWPGPRGSLVDCAEDLGGSRMT